MRGYSKKNDWQPTDRRLVQDITDIPTKGSKKRGIELLGRAATLEHAFVVPARGCRARDRKKELAPVYVADAPPEEGGEEWRRSSCQ